MGKVHYSKIKKYLELKLRKSSREEIKTIGAKGWVKYLALYFAVVTGSRPCEAAHVIMNKKFYPNKGATNERWGRIDYKATMTERLTKTHRNYIWLIPSKRNWFVNFVKKADVSCFSKPFFL